MEEAHSSHPPVDYRYLRQLVFEQSQNVLDPSRDYLFDTRLQRLLDSKGLAHISELVQLLRLRRDPKLERSVAEAMTINETSFFRDGRPFDLLRAELLPRLIEARRHSRVLRIWSAACSTGQEAYSLSMLLAEHFPQLSGWDVRIEATDISQEAVHRAQAACYSRIEMNRGLPARAIVRFFEHHGEDWTIKQEIQQICHFRQANLCGGRLPFSESFDVILLRNVMLYFSQETRRELMGNMLRMIAPDGILFLGSSEQPANPERWIPVLAGGTCCYRPRLPG